MSTNFQTSGSPGGGGVQPLSLFVCHANVRERVCQIRHVLRGGKPEPIPASR